MNASIQYVINAQRDDTNRSIQNFTALCLLLPDDGEGPLWRITVLFIAGLTSHRNRHTHTQHKNTITLIVRSTAAQQRSDETSIGAPSRRLPVRVFRAAVAVPLLPVPPVPVNQLAEVGRLLAVLDDELVLEELLGCGTLCGEEDRI